MKPFIACIAMAILLVAAAADGAARMGPGEELVLFPAFATPAEDGTAWNAEINGWFFDPTRKAAIQQKIGESLLELSKAAPANPTQHERDNARERLHMFFVDSESGRQLAVQVGSDTLPVTGCGTPKRATSGGDGLLHGCVRIPAPLVPAGEGRILFRAAEAPTVEGVIRFIQATGVSIVSDIDDTIKVTEVNNHSAMLRRTFYEDFEPVRGMAEVYSAWARSTPSLHVHYVSASPWQLYRFLTELLESRGFPPGTFHLKQFRFKNPHEFVHFFTQAPDRYKIATIEPIMKALPKRCFVLIGDSGEKDPEAYAALSAKHRDQVARIFIRDLTGQGRRAGRYVKAFSAVPDPVWAVFSEPSELPSTLPSDCPAAAR